MDNLGSYSKAIEILDSVKADCRSLEGTKELLKLKRLFRDAQESELEAFEIHNSQGFSINWNPEVTQGGCDVEY